MKKITYLPALLLLLAVVGCSKSPSSQSGGEDKTGILFNVNTNHDLKIVTSRAVDPVYWIDLTGTQIISFALEAELVEVAPGPYTVTATSPVGTNGVTAMPAWNTPVYTGSTDVTVPAKGTATAAITTTQANSGVRIVFDNTIKEAYGALVAKIENSSSESLSFNYNTESVATQMAYFNPGVLTITLEDGSTSVNIGGDASHELTAIARTNYIITLKTSAEATGGIIFEISKEDPDEETTEIGVGAVTGDGTLASPYSIGSAINAMPLKGVWIEGYVVGSATLTRSMEAVFIGDRLTSEIGKSLVLNITTAPALAQLEYLIGQDKKVMILADVIGKTSDFGSEGLAVITNIADFDFEGRQTALDGSVPITASGNTMKDLAPNSIFRMGATVKTDWMSKTSYTGDDLITQTKYKSLIGRDFNSITLEYEMKMADQVKFYNAPTEYSYRIDWINNLMTWAQTNNVAVHGHVLIWGQNSKSLPSEWFEKTNDEVKQGMLDHIQTMMLRYPTVRSWDVVNEAFANNANDNGGDGYWAWGTTANEQLWRKAYDHDGRAYIQAAFTKAREVAKANSLDCKLFYNDYGTEFYTNKRALMAQEIKAINDAHAAANSGETLIDGIGLQMHIKIGAYEKATKASVIAALESAMTAAHYIHVSELTIEINGTITDELRAQQYQLYNDVFEAIIETVPADRLWGITSWGVYDDSSSYGLKESFLFDSGFNAKQPYFDVIRNLAK